MNLIHDLAVVRAAEKNLSHSSGAAEQQESRWLSQVISDYERQPTDEHAERLSEAAARSIEIKSYKDACDYCAAINVSNECVSYNPATNQYLVRDL